MARKPKTIHLLSIADSLKEQNERVAMLLAVCRSVVQFWPAAPDPAELREKLQTQIDAVSAAFYPEEE